MDRREKSGNGLSPLRGGINSIDSLLQQEMDLTRNIDKESSEWVRGRVLLPLGLACGVFLIALALWWARRRSNTSEAELFLTSHVGPVYRVFRVLIPWNILSGRGLWSREFSGNSPTRLLLNPGGCPSPGLYDSTSFYPPLCADDDPWFHVHFLWVCPLALAVGCSDECLDGS